MKKMLNTVVAAAVAAIATMANAEYVSVDLADGTTAVPAPSRAVYVQACSTNDSASVVVEKITPLVQHIPVVRVVTNDVWATAYSNTTHTATNEIVSVWKTNTVDDVVVSNLVTVATNSVPVYTPAADIVVTTNEVEYQAFDARVPYTYILSRTFETRTDVRKKTRYFTNDVASITLSSGFMTNAPAGVVFSPGDYVSCTGSVFSYGKVTLILER